MPASCAIAEDRLDDQQRESRCAFADEAGPLAAPVLEVPEPHERPRQAGLCHADRHAHHPDVHSDIEGVEETRLELVGPTTIYAFMQATWSTTTSVAFAGKR
jgi:hypothetical protein